jgi:hypothetical protein
MSLSGTLDPGQLAIITAVLDDYCRRAGIADPSSERDLLARLAIDLFVKGVRSPGELKQALAQSREAGSAA